MSTTPTLGARIGRRYPKPDSAADAMDALGLSVPQGVKRMSRAQDYFSNAAARMGWGTPSLTEATEYDLVRLSFNYTLMYTLYRNHWIARRVVDVPAQDMVRAWPRLTSELDPKKLSKIDRAIRDTQVKANLLRALQWSRLFGGAGALIMIEGHDTKLDQPLDFDTIGIGAFKGIIPFDMWSGIHPGAEICDDITKPREFNLPTHYRVNVPNGGGGFDVHSSRILRFCGPQVPTPEYQAEMYWGISVLEVIYEELRKRDNLSWNLLSLTYRANLIGIEYPELAQALSGAGMNANALQQFYSRMQAVNDLMSNQSLLMLPKDGKLQGLMYPFTGLADVLQQFQLDIAGAAELPVTKLFGRTLTGLGQSNDADIEMYEQKIAMEQTVNMQPQLDPLYRVICISELGEIPDDMDLSFPSVRVLDEKQKGDLAKTIGDTVVAYFNAGLLNRPQAMMEIKQTSDITGIGTNLTDEDIAQAEEEDRMATELGLSGPGEQGEQPDSEQNGSEGGTRARDAFGFSALSDAWRESEHPRVRSGPRGGQFTPGGGGGSGPHTGKTPTIPTSQYPLNKKQAAVEKTFRNQIQSDPEHWKKVYRDKFGNVLNADNAKELSDDYRSDPTEYAMAVHEPASWLVKQMFQEDLNRPVGPGDSGMMVFTAGGAGAGKTTALTGEKRYLDGAHGILDGTMRPAKKAQEFVQRTLEAGKTARVYFIYRDPVEAFQNGVLGRAMRTGRTVPIEEFAHQHSSVQDSMTSLEQQFGGEENFRLTVIDNRYGAGNSKMSSLEELPKAPKFEELVELLHVELEAAFRSGKITEKVYHATRASGGSREIGV